MMYVIVDEMHAEYPELTKDRYWGMHGVDIDLPYTGAAIEDSLKENTEGELHATKDIV